MTRNETVIRPTNMNTPVAVHAAFVLFRFPYQSMQIIKSNYISFFILFIHNKKKTALPSQLGPG